MTSPSKSELLLRTFSITLDGPAGSGKTTTAREVARRLQLRHLDTGAMYRAVTLVALERGVDVADADAVGEIAHGMDIEFVERGEEPQQVLVNGRDATEAIRSREVTRNVSQVSAHAEVRRAMVRRQRQLADEGGAVLEGRDTGSVVLPWADVKVYLDASVEVRAERRHKELQGKDPSATVDKEAVRADIVRRDRLDSSRALSPLKVPAGATVLDTSDLTIEEQVRAVVALARRTADRLSVAWVGPGEKYSHRVWWFWRLGRVIIRVALHFVWCARVVRKDRRCFDEGVIFAANHRSNADPPIVCACVDREMYFVAKQSLFRPPGFGRLIRALHAVPIRRGSFDRAAMAGFLSLLAAGESVLIFPEGGRMRTDALGLPKAGVGLLALQSGRPIVPVFIKGSGRLLRSLFHRPRLTVVVGKPIRVSDGTPQGQPNREAVREVAETVMVAIAGLRDDLDLAS